MDNPTNPDTPDGVLPLDPMFNGMPVLVRLVGREDILCILFQSREENESRLFMERPLRILMEEITPEQSARNTIGRTNTVYSTVRTRFDRWIPFTSALIFPIYPEHILSIAPLADAYTNSYMQWADQLYEGDPITSHSPTTPGTSDNMSSGDTIGNIERSYIDYLLHTFTQKGKPH